MQTPSLCYIVYVYSKDALRHPLSLPVYISPSLPAIIMFLFPSLAISLASLSMLMLCRTISCYLSRLPLYVNAMSYHHLLSLSPPSLCQCYVAPSLAICLASLYMLMLCRTVSRYLSRLPLYVNAMSHRLLLSVSPPSIC